MTSSHSRPSRHSFRDLVLELPVWDTHTHLVPDALVAQSFWDIGHYFWFLRELQAAGYPQHPDDLTGDERVAAFLKAFVATGNTSMNWVVRRIFKDLYDLEITDADSVHAAGEAVRHSAAQPGWVRQVIDKLAIKRICFHERTPRQRAREFVHTPGVAYTVPIDANLRWRDLVARIKSASAPHSEAEAVAAEIERAVAALAQAGVRCMRAPAAPFDRLGSAAYQGLGQLPGAVTHEIEAFLGHVLFSALAQHKMVAQLFLGVEPTCRGVVVAVNDTRRVPNLHGLFRRYDCKFELIAGAELLNLDVVQAARIFPNVYVGGMWWYNFRASTYRQSMQYRLEALPPAKCALVVSDARCIEWCYGKISLIKRLLADFLYDQIELEWLDTGEALRVAKWWLYHTPKTLYT